MKNPVVRLMSEFRPLKNLVIQRRFDHWSVEDCQQFFQSYKRTDVLEKEEEETCIWRSWGPDGRHYFLKEYKVPPWKQGLSIFTRSRAGREFRALLAMEQANLPVASPCWFAELAKGPMLAASVLVTQSLGQVVPLSIAVQQGQSDAEMLCRCAGKLLRKVHDAGFGHFRMQAKNIMVATEKADALFLLDAPYSCHWANPLPTRIRLLDLEDLCGGHSVFSELQKRWIWEAYQEQDGWAVGQSEYHPGSRSRWGQKLRRIAYYLGAIWSGHRP